MPIYGWNSLNAPLAYPLGFEIPPPTPETFVCFESLQTSMSPPTLSAIETQILTPEPDYPYTEIFRNTFVNNCTNSNWNVSIARTVLFYMATTGLSGILNDLYPGLFPDTGILCQRKRTTVVDAALSGLYPMYPRMSAELASRGIPTPHLNLLSSNVSQQESPVYRVCSIATAICLSSVLTLRGS